VWYHRAPPVAALPYHRAAVSSRRRIIAPPYHRAAVSSRRRTIRELFRSPDVQASQLTFVATEAKSSKREPTKRMPIPESMQVVESIADKAL
jgi:hypothetical protein